MLPVCVCVPPFDFAEPVGFAAPPFAAPVVDAEVDVGVDAEVELGADAVLLTEPAVITTGK